MKNKLFKKLLKSIDQARENKITSYTSSEDLLKDLRKPLPWYKGVYYFFCRLWDDVSSISDYIKRFVQRGRRGYADSDVWNLNDYIADIMIGATKDLAKQAHGCPMSLIYGEEPTDLTSLKIDEYLAQNETEAFEKWKQIIIKIGVTFELFKKISEYSWVYIESDKYTEEWRKKQQDTCDKIKQSCPHYEGRVMTLEEIKQYEEGWLLFRKYFANLWD